VISRLAGREAEAAAFPERARAAITKAEDGSTGTRTDISQSRQQSFIQYFPTITPAG
jgi:hypothetical protein